MSTAPTAAVPGKAEKTADQIAAELKVPFHSAHVKWKPQKVSGNRAMALAYVDARVIQGRLDGVLGINNWKDSYEVLPDGCVVCRLSIRVEGEWIAKEDVGAPSEQPDEHDRTKASYSDALKRAAAKFGVGRYLWTVGQMWEDYDPQKRQFLRKPQLPAQFRHPDELTDRPAPGKSGNGAPAATAARPQSPPTPAPPPPETPDGPAADVTEDALTGGNPKDRPVEQEQLDLIEQLMGRTGVTGKRVLGETGRKFGVSDFSTFTYPVADWVISRLRSTLGEGEKKRREQRESNSAGKRVGTAGY